MVDRLFFIERFIYLRELNRIVTKKKMESNIKTQHRFYEFLPKLVDLIGNYIKDSAGISEKHEQLIKDLQNLASEIRIQCEKKSFVKFDPFIMLDKMRHNAVSKGDRKFLRSFFYARKIRQMFFSNQEIRNANLISSFQSTFLSETSISNYQKEVDKILENQNQSLSRSPPLNCLVDSCLRPIYSTYFHLYEAKYFPSTHKAINSYYLSSLLPIIIRGNPASSVSAYESELISTKDMLDYLIEYSINSRTEYELFELNRKHPNLKVVMKSPPYIQKKEELDNVVKLFLDMMKNYDLQFENLKNVFYQRLTKMEEQNELVEEGRKKLSTLHKRVETVRSSYRILRYIDQIFKSQHAPKPMSGPIQPSLISLFQPLLDWSSIQDAIYDILTSDSPTIQDFDKCITDLNTYNTKLRNALSHLYDKEKSKEDELNISRAQFSSRSANFDLDTAKKFDESYKTMEKLRNDAFKDNIARLKEKSDAKHEYDWHVCSISRITERKPIANLMEPIINLSDPSKIENDNSEIKRRMQEIDELKILLKKREDEIEADKKLIFEFSSERKEEEKVKKEKAKTLTIAAIDEKYTEARMFITCMNCDAPSEFLAKPCKHKICKKCHEKSKKKKTHCPVCGQSVEKFIKLNW